MATRDFSKVQETSVARALGGTVVANSGATAFYKGDVRTKTFLIECKTVCKEQTSFTVKKEWLTKMKQEAFAMSKDNSALAINFGPGEKSYYVIDESLMQTLVDYLESSN